MEVYEKMWFHTLVNISLMGLWCNVWFTEFRCSTMCFQLMKVNCNLLVEWHRWLVLVCTFVQTHKPTVEVIHENVHFEWETAGGWPEDHHYTLGLICPNVKSGISKKKKKRSYSKASWTESQLQPLWGNIRFKWTNIIKIIYYLCIKK